MLLKNLLLLSEESMYTLELPLFPRDKTLFWFSAGDSRHGRVGHLRCQISVSLISAFLKSHIVQLGQAENRLQKTKKK
jgi:hypothetical protein